MKKLTTKAVALLAAALLSCADTTSDVTEGETHSSEQPIVGGTVATAAAWPWIVSLRTSSGAHDCGGTLIDDDWVLTAAHCGTPASIRIGPDAAAVTRNVAQVIPHPSYNVSTAANDIALIRLSQAVPSVAPVRLNRDGGFPSTIPHNEATNTAQANTRAAGWGRTSATGPLSSVLLETAVPAVTNASCASAFAGALRPVLASNLCAGFSGGGTGVCNGDSGGPLAYAFGGSVQAGITSWGSPCARPGFPDVYTRVSSYADWITQHVPDAKTFSPTAIIVTVTSI